MNNYKESILATILILLAFTGGYNHKTLSHFWEEALSVQTNSNNDSLRTDSTIKTNMPKNIPDKEQLNTKQNSQFAIGSSSKWSQSSVATVNVENPYQNSFASTLDSIKPGEIEKKQEQKRNLYFDHLREQLKELQGGVIPPSPSAENKNLDSKEVDKEEHSERPGAMFYNSSSSAVYGAEGVQIPLPDVTSGNRHSITQSDKGAEDDAVIPDLQNEPDDELEDTSLIDSLEQNE